MENISKIEKEHMKRNKEKLEYFESKTLWANQEMFLQMNKVKFGNFYDEVLDQEVEALRDESRITLSMLYNEINNALQGLTIFESVYDHLILQMNKNFREKIIRVFQSHKFNVIQYKLLPILLSRQINLVKCYILFIQFKHNGDIADAASSSHELEDYLKENYYIYLSNEDLFYSNVMKDIGNYLFPAKSANEIIHQSLSNEKKIIDFLECKMKVIEGNVHSGFIFKPSLALLIISFKFLNRIIAKLLDSIKNLQQKISICHLTKFYKLLSSLHNYMAIFPNNIQVPDTDLFNCPEYSQTWEEIKTTHEIRIYYPQAKLRKKIFEVGTTMCLSVASVAMSRNKTSQVISNNGQSSSYSSNINCGLFSSLAYYFLRKSKAKLISSSLELHPNFEITRLAIHLADSKPLKHLVKLGMRRIKYSKKVYLKRTMVTIDLCLISNLMNFISKSEVNFSRRILSRDQIYPNFRDFYAEQHRYEIKYPNQEYFYHYNSDIITDLYVRTFNDKKRKRDYIKARLISSAKNHIPLLSQHHSFWGWFNFLTPSIPHKYTNSIILHIHGGGFIATSSSSHESYTRQWAKKLRVPILSIDYRLAPEYPYPSALDDVFQAYMWIINHCHKEWNIKPERIILVGDSAGGNLAIALTFLLIIMMHPLPAALVLAYPACDNGLEIIPPSVFNSLEDPILSFQVLNFAKNSYKGSYTKETQDPFFSPILMHDKVLMHMPPCRFLFGSYDPLRDYMIYFINRLHYLHKDVKSIELKYFPHGFLNFDTKALMPEMHIGVKIMMDEIEPFLK